MHRSILRLPRFASRSTLVVAVLAALLLGSTSPAFAQDTDTRSVMGGQVTTWEQAQRARGTAAADASGAAGSGALEVSASAEAGRALLGLLGGRSTASATAEVRNTVGVTAGAYDVTFTYGNTNAATTAEPGAAASVLANSVATFTSGDEADKTEEPHIDFRDVRQRGGDLVVTLSFTVPEDGSLFLVGRLIASTDSTREGAGATATGSVDRTTVTIERTG